MIVEIRSSFQKDAKKLSMSIRLELSIIIESLQTTMSLSEIPNCKKLTGFKNAYRIKFKSYRIGFFFDNKKIELVRILNRKDIYRYFP